MDMMCSRRLDDRSHWKVLSIQEIILKVQNKEKSSCSEV